MAGRTSNLGRSSAGRIHPHTDSRAEQPHKTAGYLMTSQNTVVVVRCVNHITHPAMCMHRRRLVGMTAASDDWSRRKAKTACRRGVRSVIFTVARQKCRVPAEYIQRYAAGLRPCRVNRGCLLTMEGPQPCRCSTWPRRTALNG